MPYLKISVVSMYKVKYLHDNLQYLQDMYTIYISYIHYIQYLQNMYPIYIIYTLYTDTCIYLYLFQRRTGLPTYAEHELGPIVKYEFGQKGFNNLNKSFRFFQKYLDLMYN